MKNSLKTLVTGLILTLSISLNYSQQYLDINYPGRTTPLPVTNSVTLYACESTPESYSILIDNTSPFTLSNFSLKFSLPAGIIYSGNFSSGTGASVSSFTDSTVSISIDSMQTQEVRTISFDIKAGCGVYQYGSTGGTFEVKMQATFTQKNTGVIQNRNYLFAPLVVNYPELQLFEQSFKSGSPAFYNLSNPKIGDTVDRKITFVNGGTSPLDSVYFSSYYSNSLSLVNYSKGAHFLTSTPPFVTNKITFGGIDFSTVGNMDNFLDPGEQLSFIEKVVIINCNNTVTDYKAAWGCGSSICQIQSTENRIIFPASSPRLKVTPSVDTSFCFGVTSGPAVKMQLYIQNYAPNTIDSAKNITVDVYQGVNGFNANFLSVIDRSTIRVRHRVSGVLVPFTLLSSNPNNSSLCNAAGTNSIGRFRIQIPKIYSGEELKVTWRVYTCCNTSCSNGNLSVYDWGYSVIYQNRCDYTYSQHTNKVGYGDRDVRHELSPGSSTSQVTSSSGLTSFNFAINNSYFDIPKEVSTDYLRYEIRKPTCMSFTNSPTNVYLEKFDGTRIHPTSANITVSGNLITVKFESGFYDLSQGKLIVKLSPDCSSCTPNPTDTISVTSFYSPSSCSVCELNLGCASIPLSILCNTGCTFFDVQYNRVSKFRRVNYGMPDVDEDGTPESTTPINYAIDSIRLDRASYGDVVKLAIDLNPGSSGDRTLASQNYIYYYAKIDNGAYFTLDSLRFQYYGLSMPSFTPFDGECKIPFDTIIRPIAGTDSVEFIIEIDLNAIKTSGCFPDLYAKLILKAFFHVNKNLGVSITQCGVDFTAFPDVTKFTSSTNINSKKSRYCHMVKDKIDLIGFDYFSHWNTYNTFKSCETIQVEERFRFNTGTWVPGNPATNFYPNEYRNFSYPDSLKITTTNSYNLIGAEMSYYRTAGTLNLNYTTYKDIMPVISGGLNSFTFDLKQLFRNPFDTAAATVAAKPFAFPDEGYMCDVRLIFEPNCNNQGGLDTIHYDWILKTDSLSPRLIGCNTPPTAKGTDRLEYVAPDNKIQPSIQLIRVQGRTAEWEVLITNNSNSDAANVWFGFNNPFTSLTVTSVSRIASGSANLMPVISSIPFGAVTTTSGVYRIHNLFGGKDIKFRITADIDPTNCDLDSLIFALSYDCDSFPSSIKSATCPLNEMPLYAQPMLPNLFNSISTSSDTISLCDTAEYVFRIENTDIGKAYDIFGNLFLQQNLNYVPGSGQIFDAKNNVWSPITPVSGGSGQYTFDVSGAISHINTNGLIGVVDKDNYVLIKFKTFAECNYTSGSRMEINSIAKSACGYSFVSPFSHSNPLHIVGATPSHKNRVILNSGFLSPCYDSTLVNLKVINLGPVNSWVGDSVTIVLPRGIHYAAGSYTPIRNATASVPSILNYGGKEHLTWTLNNLVSLIDTAEFTIEVYSIPDTIKTCDANYIYTYTTTQDSVVCASTGTNCGVKIISGDTTEAIFTYKATTALSNPVATSIPNPPSGERVTVSFDINNLGQTIKDVVNGLPNGTTVSFYSDVDNNGILSFSDTLITTKTSFITVPQGLSTYTDTVDLPAGTACRFIAVIDFDLNSCVCNTSEILFTTVSLVSNEPNDTVCENEPELIGYLDSISNYTYTWTAGTNASLSYLSSSKAAAPTITAPNITAGIDSMEYFIEIERLGCLAYDTIMVYVLNNPIADAGNDTTVCYDSTRLNGNVVSLGVSGTGSLNSYWVVDSSYGNGFAGVIINDSSNANSLVNGLYNGSYRFIWVIDNGRCTPSTDTVEITVVNPVFTAGVDTVLCSASNYTLTGSITSTGFTSNWTILPSSPAGATLSSASSPTATLQNLVDGVYTLELSITSGSCVFYDTVVIDVNAIDTISAGLDSAFCGINNFNLWATPVSFRRTGVWTIDSTLGNFSNVTFASINSANSGVTFSSNGVYRLIWNSVHTICDTVKDTVEITIADTLIVNAGADTNLCDVTQYNLNASPLKVLEIGTWSVLSGANTPSFSNANSPTSTVTGLIPVGTYEFVWSVSNGICDNVKDTVRVTVVPTPVANAGVDTGLCSSTGYTLQGNAIRSNETGTWRLASPGTLTFADSTLPNTAITNLSHGVYTLVWTVKNGVCDSVMDTVVITVDSMPVANAGLNDTICISDIATFAMGATAVTGREVGTWTQLSGPNSITFVNVNSSTTGITGLITGTYEYIWTVRNGICDSVTDTVQVTILPVPGANAGANDTICISDTLTFTLSAVATAIHEIGTWSQLSGSSISGFGNVHLPNTTVSGLSAGVYEFVWTVSNSGCNPVKDTVEITVYGTPVANAGVDLFSCSPMITNLSANTPGMFQTGTWSNATGNPTVAIFSNANSPTSTVSNLNYGTYTFVWTITNSICPADRDSVVLKIDSISTPFAGVDDTICHNQTYVLNANAVSSSIDTGTWTQIDLNPAVLFTDVHDPKATVSGISPNDYIFVWTVRNSICPSVSDTVRVSIYEASMAQAGSDKRFCKDSVTTLTAINSHAKGYHNYSWTYNLAGSNATTTPIINSTNTISTKISNLDVGIYSFVLEVDNGGYCPLSRDTIQVTVLALPVVDFNVDDQSVCLGICNNFTNASTILDPTGSSIAKYQWTFGDGNASNAVNPTHCYDAIGSYDVTLYATSNYGCVDSVVKTGYISVNPIPIAAFEVEPTTINPYAQVIITDNSIGANSYVYDLGNGSFSTNPSPIYRYTDTGTYIVEQKVINVFGCRDSITKIVKVQDEVNIYIPNAFTPNGDGDNDEFIPVLHSVDPNKYQFLVFNRWGEVLFQTSDVHKGWDGTYKGAKVQQGAYVYKITYKEKNGYKTYKKEGHVTLLK